ncbi:Inactive serine/threonine-protein kinase lvsg, partial [Globisporangium splendens]
MENGGGEKGCERGADGGAERKRQQKPRDVRDDIRAHLRWEFSYASVDPLEARCLVTTQVRAPGEEGERREHEEAQERVLEWFVRKFPGQSAEKKQRIQRKQRDVRYVRRESEPLARTHDDNTTNENGVRALRGGLETQLEIELGFHRNVRGASVAAQRRQPSEQQVSPIALLELFYSDIPIYKAPIDSKRLQDQLIARKAVAKSVHLSPLRGVYQFPTEESASGVRDDPASLAIFEYEKYSLQDVLKYNRHVLHDDGKTQGEELALSDLKKRFLIYQLRRMLQFLHDQDVACGGFSPNEILLTDTLWVRLGSLPFVQSTSGEAETNLERKSQAPLLQEPIESLQMSRSVASFSTRSVTEQWCDGDISNFEYLMLLNKAAGRRMAKEYPSSIARMYDWTPDECIPEFYTEPDVFKSIHGEEMEDLELPTWCEDAADFIRVHRKMLEGDEVSSQLHTWIDLNFGVSLSGDQAVKQKNVPLKVQKESQLEKSPGFVQVFDASHPAKKTIKKSLPDAILESSSTCSFPQGEGTDREQVDRSQLLMTLFRPSEMKKQAEGMLAKALLIANDSNEVVAAPTSDASDGTRMVQSSHLTVSGQMSQSPALPSSSKSQSLVRLKQRRKTKSRPRSHGSEPPLSPPSSLNDGSAKSPTVSRLATVIPNFFHPDSAHTHTSCNAIGGGSAFAFPAGSESPSNSSAFAGGASGSKQHGDGTDQMRMLAISAPLIHGVNEDTSTQFARGAPVSNHTNAHAGSHIFRDFWQQISKPEEFDADFTSENSGYDVLDYDWGETDFEHLDEMDLQLLRVGLPIKISTSSALQDKDPSPEFKNVQTAQVSLTELEDRAHEQSSMELETRASLRRTVEAVVDPAYSLPRSYIENIIPDTRELTDQEFRKAADLFSLGCIIAEIYTLTPLFSKRSIVEYFNLFRQVNAPTCNPQTDMETKLEQPDSWNNAIASKLREMPINMKNAVLALIHPHPKERLLLIGVLDGKEVHSILCSLQRKNDSKLQPSLKPAHSTILNEEFCPSQYNLFPAEFALMYRFLSQYNRSSNWRDRFDTARLFLPSLVQLPPQQFRVVFPVISQFFHASSHTESIRVERVVAAIVFLLPSLNAQLDKLGMKQELTRDILRAYESSELTFLMKICLSAPEVLKEVVKSFGNIAFIECFLPVLVDWIVSTPSLGLSEGLTWAPSLNVDEASRCMTKIPLFASEALAVTALAVGELASANILGPSLASKFILTSLLPHLGKIKNKWTKLTKSSTLRKKGSSSYRSGVDDLGSELSGHNNDGIHVTFMAKSCLYEPHYVADALLLVCREISDYPVRSILLPHIFDVLPKLIVLAEKIGSVRVEGVPGDLGREIYVILRILRHIIRNLSDAHIQSDLLYRKDNGLVGMLEAIEPPFLHPQTAAAIIAAATSSKTAHAYIHEGSSTSSRSNVAVVNTTKQKILRSLSVMKKENHRELRAFIVVGLARTIVAMCQKIGPDATISAVPLVQGINKFLTRCSVVYSQLEVSNFQWHLASEIVSELCIPLRSLLGKDVFGKYFPIVQSNSVLQLLLLPIGGNTSQNVSVLDDRLAKQSGERERDPGRNMLDATLDVGWNGTQDKLKAISKNSHSLLRFAYRTVRLNSVKSTSFLHIPSTILNQNQQDLNEIFRVQDERHKRTVLLSSSLSSSVQRAAFDNAWLRPLVKKPFGGRSFPESSPDIGPGGGNYHSFPLTYSSGSNRSGALESWTFTSEIRNSIKAHSSSVRALSVDLEEEIVLSGSKNGSCRAWRLASHPCHAQAAVQTASPILSVQNAMDGTHAIAMEAACVHVWDIRTSQVRVKLPFVEENVNSIALLRSLPLHPHLTNPLFGASAILGSADFAVSTSHKVLCVDLRSGPRVVSDWRVDVRDAVNISTLATIFSSSSSQVYIAAGTTAGVIILIDRQTGKQMARWQALNGKIIKIVQFSPSQFLAVGAEREARVWSLRHLHKPRVQMIVTGIPEAIRESQVAVQPYTDMNVLYVACSSKLYTARLPSESDAIKSSGENDVVAPTVRVDASYLMEPSLSSLSSNSTKMSKSKVSSQSVCVLPLRQLVLVGSDDGVLKCVI